MTASKKVTFNLTSKLWCTTFHGHVIEFECLAITFTTVAGSCNHMTAICNLPSWLEQGKSIGETVFAKQLCDSLWRLFNSLNNCGNLLKNCDKNGWKIWFSHVMICSTTILLCNQNSSPNCHKSKAICRRLVGHTRFLFTMQTVNSLIWLSFYYDLQYKNIHILGKMFYRTIHRVLTLI